MPRNSARPKVVLSRSRSVVHWLHFCWDGTKKTSFHGRQWDRLNFQDIQGSGHSKWIKLARGAEVAGLQAHLPKMEGYPSNRAYIKSRWGRHGPTRRYGRSRPKQENLSTYGTPSSLFWFAWQEQAALHILTSCCWLSNDCDIYKRCTFKATIFTKKNVDWYQSKYIILKLTERRNKHPHSHTNRSQ